MEGQTGLYQCSEPNTYPISTAHIWHQEANAKNWVFMQSIPADSFIQRRLKAGTFDADFEMYFAEQNVVHCPQTNLMEQKIGICFSQLFSFDWPEIHVWNDHLASTGILMDSYMFVDGKYLKVLERRGRFQKIADQWCSVEDFVIYQQDQWQAQTGGVKSYDVKNHQFVDDLPLMSQYFKMEIPTVSVIDMPNPHQGFLCIETGKRMRTRRCVYYSPAAVNKLLEQWNPQ